MSTPDPVTAPSIKDPTDDELYSAAMTAVARVLARRWHNDDEPALLRNASVLVDLAIEVGSRDAVVLIRDHHPDCVRLAAAVLATDPGHNGQPPNPADLAAAASVINTLLDGG